MLHVKLWVVNLIIHKWSKSSLAAYLNNSHKIKFDGKWNALHKFIVHIRSSDRIAATMVVGTPTVLINDPVLHLSPLHEQAQTSFLTNNALTF